MSHAESGYEAIELLRAIAADTNREEAYHELHSKIGAVPLTAEVMLELAPDSSYEQFQGSLATVLSTKIQTSSGAHVAAFEGTGTLVTTDHSGKLMSFWHNPNAELERRYGSGIPYAIKKAADGLLAKGALNADASTQPGYDYIRKVQQRLGLQTGTAGHHIGSAFFCPPGVTCDRSIWFVAGASGVLATDEIRNAWKQEPGMAAVVESGKQAQLYDWDKDMCAGAVDSVFGRAVLEDMWSLGVHDDEAVSLDFSGPEYERVNIH